MVFVAAIRSSSRPRLAAGVSFTFDLPGVGDATEQRGPMVLFFELASWQDDQVVVESNTLAILVDPLDG